MLLKHLALKLGFTLESLRLVVIVAVLVGLVMTINMAKALQATYCHINAKLNEKNSQIKFASKLNTRKTSNVEQEKGKGKCCLLFRAILSNN